MVRLPLASAELPGAQAAKVLAAPKPVSNARRRVLVVEDGDDLRIAFQEYLAALGHEVSVAGDGPQGAIQNLKLLPDVSFVDVGLPGFDGYEVARRVRASPGGERLYLVVLTGYGGAEVRAKAIEAGFNLQLTKPVDVSELEELVNNSRASG